MTRPTPTDAQLAHQVAAHQPAANSLWSRIGLRVQLGISLALAGAVLLFLILQPYFSSWASAEQHKPPPAPNPVEEIHPNLVRIQPGSALERYLKDGITKVKLKEAPKDVKLKSVKTPLLVVTGSVIASPRGGEGNVKGFWQFSTAELLSTYADWEKAVADVAFQAKQLQAVKELAEQRVTAQQKLVKRMKALMDAGTESLKNLDAERNNLLQFQIQGRKEVHEAEKALRDANKTEAALHRQLQQGGVEPKLLRDTKTNEDIVVADVPERNAGQVKVGQPCTAEFFAFKGLEFPGKVVAISPVISKEKRTLRVLFTVKDPDYKLRPGMFAEIGVGKAEKIKVMPLDGVLHVGRADYALVQAGPNTWRITEIKVGERYGNDIEVLEGLDLGKTVLGRGAILLKPVLTRLLSADVPAATTPAPKAKGP